MSDTGCARGETKTAPARERPILFSGPMVQAILAGRKTQKRMVVSSCAAREPGLFMSVSLQKAPDFDPESGEWYEDGGMWHKRCPFGVPGDRLWVRETFAIESNRGLTYGSDYQPPFSDGRPVNWHEDAEDGRWWEQAHYRATEPTHDLVRDADNDGEDQMGRWSPSIHMPRWASRITLEITDVRVQRLQEISEEDARAEGFEPEPFDGKDIASLPAGSDARRVAEALGPGEFTAKCEFAMGWDSSDAARGHGWGTNPWVWAITFRRIS